MSEYEVFESVLLHTRLGHGWIQEISVEVYAVCGP